MFNVNWCGYIIFYVHADCKQEKVLNLFPYTERKNFVFDIYKSTNKDYNIYVNSKNSKRKVGMP